MTPAHLTVRIMPTRARRVTWQIDAAWYWAERFPRLATVALARGESLPWFFLRAINLADANRATRRRWGER